MLPVVAVQAALVRVFDRTPALIKDMQWLSNAFVAIGWDAQSGKYPDGTPIAAVANYNEFGTYNEDHSVRNPARPFMRPAYNNNRPAINALRTQVVQKVAEGKLNPEKGLDMLGFRLMTYIQSAIKSNTPPPLSARTLARKRAAGRPAVTLIDTRRMLDTLTYKIYMGPFSAGSQTETAKGALAAASVASQRASDASAAKVMRMRTAQQIRAEKQRLREELAAAKATKKREEVRAAKKVRTAKKVAAKKLAGQYRKYKKQETRKKKAKTAFRKKNEAYAAKVKHRADTAYKKQVTHLVKVQQAKERRMAHRDKREAKGLSRIAKLTPKQKQAKLARQKLQKENKARIREEKRAEKREMKTEKMATRQLKLAKQSAKKKPGRRSEEKLQKAKNNYIKIFGKGLPK